MNKKEPIAIVGMSCRFPGGCTTPEQYWQLLTRGADAITEIESDRWATEYYFHPDRNSPGRTYTRAAGQLPDVFHFDAGFFGISPREAAQMDPQQRLLLELTWEALEDGGQIADSLAGRNSSVFIGISSTDHGNSLLADPSAADGYFMTGNTLSIAANRISYLFDLRGPSMAIDTACSSSLVALHQGCNSIWCGDVPDAIVGAVHLLLSPYPFIGFSKASMLSADGRCKVFDSSANGYVRSEGGAVLYLKPLSRAVADGDPVHAVILGTRVNSDGRNSGLTVPNGGAQEDLLNKVYADAGIPVDRISYIEAHGTGTPVGDPIEAAAIGAALGSRRARTAPIWIGSAKSNIGHLEPASGVAGLLKVVMSLKHRTVPASIHCEELSPDIDFDALNLRVVQKQLPLADVNGELIMGVNSFGFGGSNAHVILGEYRAEARAAPAAPPVDATLPLVLSANSDASLKARALQFAQLLEQDGVEPYDVLFTAATRLQRLRYGLAVAADEPAALAASLKRFAEGEKPAEVITAERIPGDPQIAFVFSGNGAQWAGMGRELLDVPEFRAAVEEVEELFGQYADWSLIEALKAPEETSRMDLTEVAQPALFAVQVGILRMLRARGIEAGAAIGHSVGEVAAAYASGALSLEDAVRVIYHRSEAQERTRGAGRMVAARLSEADARKWVDLFDGDIELAAINSPDSVTFSGPVAAMESLAEKLRAEGIVGRMLNLDYAFHSRAMDAVRGHFIESMGSLNPGPAALDFISTVSGESKPGEELDVSYWWDNVRRPVQFGAGVAKLLEQGFNLFIEIGPHPILKTYLRECVHREHRSGQVLTTLERDRNAAGCITRAVYQSYLLNPDLDVSRFFPVPGSLVPVPPYPWDRSEFRVARTLEADSTTREHPLLGYPVYGFESAWLNHVDLHLQPFLADHVVDEVPVYPGAGYIEMALAASRSLSGRGSHELVSLDIRKPLLLSDEKTKEVQFVLTTDDYRFRIRSRDRMSGQDFVTHVEGKISTAGPVPRREPVDVEYLRSTAREFVSGRQVYTQAEAIGLRYGPAFRAVNGVWLAGEQLLAEIVLPAAAGDASAYVLHPVIADAAFHTLFPALGQAARVQGIADKAPVVPVSFGSINVYGDTAAIRYCVCRILSASARGARASFMLLDQDGTVLAEMKDCLFKRLGVGAESGRLPAIYDYSTIPMNHINPRVATPLPDTDALAEHVARAMEESAAQQEAHTFSEEVLPLYDALASCLAEAALRELGAGLGDFDIDGLLAATGVSTEHKRFIAFLLQMLEEDGKATRRGPTWTLAQQAEGVSAEAIWRSIIADHPQYTSELLTSVSRGFQLCSLLTDRAVFSTEAVQTPLHPVAVDTCRAVLAHVTQNWPRHRRRLRIAEIKDHTSTLSNEFISLLPAAYCDYEVLVLDGETRIGAEQQYRQFRNANVTETDFSRDMVVQEFDEGEFDILIVSNNLYKSPDIQQWLSCASYLLASGGLLLLNEKASDRLTDLNEGIEPEWWSRSPDSESPTSRRLDVDDWIMALELSGFVDCRALTRADIRGACHCTIAARRPVRAEEQSETPARASGGWLLLAEGTGHSVAVAESIREELGGAAAPVRIAVDARTVNGNGSRHISVDMGSENGFAGLLETLKEQEFEFENIVFLPALVSVAGLQGDAVFNKQKRLCAALASFLGAISRDGLGNRRLWLVSAGAVVPGMPVIDGEKGRSPAFSLLWGMGRVIRNEYPDLDCSLIEVQGMQSVQKIARALVDEIRQADEEDEIILSADVRQVLRLTEATESRQPAGGDADQPPGYRLEIARPGALDELRWTRMERRPPGHGEIAVRVAATGLNFRDVMYASGLLPDEMLEQGFAGPTLGMECAGVVTGTGPGVSAFQPGDEVITFAPSCFSSDIVTSAALAVAKPAEWTFAQAATVPVVFFTVYYALHHLGRLREGERILIHGAGGGVGLAAIQYARYCGAEIFASAGTVEKREFLYRLGVDHVLNSRSLDFADEIMALTDGEGVDVVLNSLAGEAIDRNLRVLRPFGRFLELGKRDFYEDTRIGLRPFRQNISYYAIDADQLLAGQPEFSRTLFSEVMSLFRQGAFRPLSHTVFHATDISGAFRYMQQSRHIGKIIVSLERELTDIHVEQPALPPVSLRPDASYLVTGGTSGFGLATARWMVERGARHLQLVSRSGAPTEEAQKTIDELRAQGVNVDVIKCDVCDALALKQVLRETMDGPRKLRGIVHAAMVLDDGLIRNLTDESIARVFGPKIRGAWNLHQLTRNSELDFFVMYSSATTCFGNPGQANYVAANYYLEALAHFRRSMGLPGLAVSWDAITDSGYLTRNTALRDRFAQQMGIKGISTRQALDVLDAMMAQDRVNAAVMRPNWGKLKQVLPISSSPLFEYVMRSVSGDAGGISLEDIAAMLKGKTEGERHIVISNILIEEVSRILHLPSSKIDHHCALQDLGVDSLMAMELAAAIESRFSIQIPILTLSDNATIDSLAAKLNKMFDDQAGDGERPSTEAAIVTALAQSHAEDLSEEEIEEFAREYEGNGVSRRRLIQ